MKFYELKKNWRKIKPHLQDKVLLKILVNDFNDYLKGNGLPRNFTSKNTPFEFESGDWFLDRRGRLPAYFQYVKHGACHYLVRFNLHLAKMVDPSREWRIISSDEHSTVWDGKETIFEFNFYAMGIPADTAFEMAFKD